MRQKFPLSCECMALPNLAVTDMFSEQEKRILTVEEVKAYGQTRWWLSLRQCKKCGECWLVAEDSRQNDIFCFKRLEKAEAEEIIQKNEWPNVFETLEELFVIGRYNHRSVRWMDPLNSSSLVESVEDLRNARPNISTGEIASLLNIDEDLAIQICEKISAEAI